MDKKFYRVGEKIYENGTNRYIDMPEWQKDWSGKATEVASPEAQKKLEQEENIMGRPSTQPEIGKMYPEYASEYGTDSSNLGALGQEKEATAQGVKSLGQPTYAINLLQEAIKKKQGTANKGIGKSPIFEKAGLTGIGSLASSLASRQGEIRDNRAYFSNIIGEAMGGYKDMMNQANFAYEAAASEYEQEMERLTDIDEELRKHKRAIELYEKKAKIDMEEAAYKNSLKGSPDPTDPTELNDEEKLFQKDLKDIRTRLAQKKLGWGDAYDTLKGNYSDIPNEILDQLLNKDKYYEQEVE